MRRLSILRRFAKRVGLEFDIENMEISLLTKTKAQGENKDELVEAGNPNQNDLDHEIFMKQ